MSWLRQIYIAQKTTPRTRGDNNTNGRGELQAPTRSVADGHCDVSTHARDSCVMGRVVIALDRVVVGFVVIYR
jgi:hypothetical protein